MTAGLPHAFMLPAPLFSCADGIMENRDKEQRELLKTQFEYASRDYANMQCYSTELTFEQCQEIGVDQVHAKLTERLIACCRDEWFDAAILAADDEQDEDAGIFASWHVELQHGEWVRTETLAAEQQTDPCTETMAEMPNPLAADVPMGKPEYTFVRRPDASGSKGKCRFFWLRRETGEQWNCRAAYRKLESLVGEAYNFLPLRESYSYAESNNVDLPRAKLSSWLYQLSLAHASSFFFTTDQPPGAPGGDINPLFNNLRDVFLSSRIALEYAEQRASENGGGGTSDKETGASGRKPEAAQQKKRGPASTLKSFIEVHCNLTGRPDIQSKVDLLHEYNRKQRIKLPKLAHRYRRGQHKYYYDDDLKKNWPTYRRNMPTLPPLKMPEK